MIRKCRVPVYVEGHLLPFMVEIGERMPGSWVVPGHTHDIISAYEHLPPRYFYEELERTPSIPIDDVFPEYIEEEDRYAGPVPVPNRLEFHYVDHTPYKILVLYRNAGMFFHSFRDCRRWVLEQIPAGFARLREKKIAKVVCRQLPEDVVLHCILSFL